MVFPWMYVNAHDDVSQEELHRLASQLAECSSPRGEPQLHLGAPVRSGPKSRQSKTVKVARVNKESSSGSDSRQRAGTCLVHAFGPLQKCSMLNAKH